MAHIVSLATAVPTNFALQEQLAAKIARASNLDERQTKWLERLYKKSAIKKRHSVLEDFCLEPSQWRFWNTSTATTQRRNEVYIQEAPKLSLEAAKKALELWGGDPKMISHIIFISCTGIVAPGIQAQLAQWLGLKSDVVQFGLNMMGCFGAFKGLDMAQAFARLDPKNRVLVVCTELCSLHFQQNAHPELQVGNAIFADGSAACVVAGEVADGETSLWRIVKTQSLLIPDTLDKMTWQVSDSGFVLGLKEEVVDCIRHNIFAFCKGLLPENVAFSDCHWPIHPGGKKILEACQDALKLTKEETQSSWRVLEEYGNMSSATFLFVLEQLFRTQTKKEWAIGVGFGPGLTFEGVLLK